MTEAGESFDVTLDKLVGVASRRRWWVLLTAAVIALGACLTSLLLPNRYESKATILVESQQVPERYVTANTTIDLGEVLLVITDAILSRTQLEQVMNKFDLYGKERKHRDTEQLVELMRRNIKIAPLQRTPDARDLDAFEISFTGDDPHLAQQVTNELTTLFIAENNRSREEQSIGTTNFLREQLDASAAELKRQESRVRDFKMAYLGELPEQQQGNLAILAGLHAELQNTMAALGRAREQQVYLQSLISRYQDFARPPGETATPTTAAAPSPPDSIKAELARLQNAKNELLARYTSKYPDVVRIDEQIRETKALLAAAESIPPASQTAPPKSSKPADTTAAVDATVAQLKSQLEANRLEIENDTAAQQAIEAKVADYQRRLNLTPVREEQLAGLLRDYELSKQHYDDLLNKKTQSELATSLETRQQGQRFRVIDPPSLPVKPSSPPRVKISLAGLVAGIALGVALGFFAETKDHSLRSETELRQAFAFPLLIGVPELLSKAEERKRTRTTALEWIGGTVLCLLICATEYLVYLRS